MYKVLIAEDEMLVRLGLKNSIDWDRFEMKVIADVSDGKAAWEVYQNESPDFIITDLRMPVMDGMELISKIRQSDTATQIVILSCLEEFELIRKAMAYGVSHYILKLTMTTEEMEAVLQKVHTHLKSQRQLRKPSLLDPMNRDAVKENCLKSFLFYHIYSEMEFAKIVTDLKLRIYPEHLVLGVMEINHFSRLKTIFRDEKGQLVKLSLLNALNEIMDSHANGEVFCENESRYVFIFNRKTNSPQGDFDPGIAEVLDSITDSMRIYFNISVTFGISSTRSGYSSLNILYFQATRQLERRFLQGPGIYLQGEAPEIRHILAEKTAVLHGFNEKVAQLGDESF